MMVDGRHFEDALTVSKTIAADLEDDRYRFDHIDAANESEKDFLFDKYSDDAQASAESERADVPHEDLRRVAVIPEKPKARTYHGSAEYRQFLRVRQAREIQVV